MPTHIFIAESLDGFIARSDGGLDWLAGYSSPGGEDYGYGSFLGRMNAVVMVRTTFETVLGFNEWPYAVGARIQY